MNSKEIRDFFEALQLLEMEKGIDGDYLIEKITNAIVIAVKRDYQVTDNVNVVINPESCRFEVSITKTAVQEVEDPATEISMDEALKYNRHPVEGMPVEIPLNPKQFGRIAAQTAKHVIRQGIREAERSRLVSQYQNKIYEVVPAVVQKIEPDTGNATVEIDKNEEILFKNEQLPNDNLKEGDHIRVYVVDVVNFERRCFLKISRTHKELVKRLFEREVPEIFDGVIEIKSISREAGSRTKMAVWSKNPDVDPIGACIGPKGSRISAIVSELKGEKIDIVKYSEDDAEFITQALSPATVTAVEILPGEERMCRVTVPDNQLSLAIGNKGQNAKLAAKLTGYKIDIRPESGVMTEKAHEAKEAKPAEEAAAAETESAETVAEAE